MSHITRVKTEIKDAEALAAALRRIGYRLLPASKGLVGADLLRPRAPSFKALRDRRQLAFHPGRDGEGPYQIEADWEAFGKTRDEILSEILRAYAVEKVTRAGRIRGYSVIRQESNANGEIEIVLRRATGGTR
jgi:hypothetical protein